MPKIMRNSRQKKYFTKFSLITLCVLKLSTLQTSSADLQSFFNGENLSKKALRYNEQSAIIQAAPTKSNDLPSVSDLLASAATDIENRLALRAADANSLAAKAKTSQTYPVNSMGDGPNSCCVKHPESGFDHYFKSEVTLSDMCYRGDCNLAGRSLSGNPTCANAVIKGDFFTEVKGNLNDAGAAWQYFGSETGVASMFPASYAGDNNCPDDPYDPRLRPWYVQALTTIPMDVVIILDKSGSMAINGRMESAKKAVKSILSMLRPYDRFSVAPFDSASTAQIMTGSDCMDQKSLAFATSKNINQMKAFIETVQPGGGTMYGYALRFAREIFAASSSSIEDEWQSDRKKVVMFLSDGDPNDSGQTIMESMKLLVEEVPNVVTMVYGLDIDNQILRDVSTHEFTKYGVSNPSQMPVDGQFEELTPHNIRIKLGRFYANPAVNPSGPSALVQYSLPYVDSFGMGLMVTASKAVIDISGNLQGVVGYDITLKYLLEPVEYMISETTYAWMFTRARGYMIYHPRMVNPSAEISDINPVHYSILEPNVAQKDAIQALIESSGAASVSYTGERFMETPREQDFTGTTKGTSTQTKEMFVTNCKTISPSGTEFDLVLCVTRIGDIQSALDTTNANSNGLAKPSTYHASSESKAGACRHGFRKAFKTTGGVKFAPRQFSIPTKYMNSVESDMELEKMENLVNGKTSINPNMETTLLEKSTATNKVMSGLDASWLSQNAQLTNNFGSSTDMVLDMFDESSELAPVWRYFGSMEGTFRMYPSTQIPQAYDPAQRGWFRQALGDKSKTFISTPYEDAFGMGYLITVSRTVNYNNNGEIAGVLGTDYFMSQFGETVLGGSDGTDQMIVDSAGYIIYHPQFASSRNPDGQNMINVKFREADGTISSGEPISVADIWSNEGRLVEVLMNAGIPLMQCHDVINLRTRKTLDFERYFEENGNVETLTVGGVEITHLVGTNAYVLKNNRFDLMQSFEWREEERLERDINGEQVKIQDRWPIVDRAEFVMDSSKYQQCENKFSGGEVIPACQGSSPGLDISYLGRFDWMTGFQKEDVNDLESCFDYMESWDYYAVFRNMETKMSMILKLLPVFFFGAFVLAGIFVVDYGMDQGARQQQEADQQQMIAQQQQQQQALLAQQQQAHANAQMMRQMNVMQQQMAQQQMMAAQAPAPVMNITIANNNTNTN